MENDREEDMKNELKWIYLKVAQHFDLPHYFINRSILVPLMEITKNCESLNRLQSRNVAEA